MIEFILISNNRELILLQTYYIRNINIMNNRMQRALLLEKRLSRIEKLVKNERSVNRLGEQSVAFQIWKFLMDNGPKSSSEIKDIFPSDKRRMIATVQHDMVEKDCIRRNGQMYTANPDYEWDDIGILSAAAKAASLSQKPSAPSRSSGVRVRSNGRIKDVAPIEEPVIEEPVIEEPVIEEPKPKKMVDTPASGNRFTATNAIKAIIKNIGNKNDKSDLLESLTIGVTAIDALDELPKKKRESLCAEFNLTYADLKNAIRVYGVAKFTKKLIAELKRQGVKVVDHDIPGERDDWDNVDDLISGDGFNNKSFDYYNDDDLHDYY